MLDEIIPALKSLKRSKMLTAEPEITKSLPVVYSKISFRPFINYLKTRRSEVSETQEKLYSHLIKKFEEAPSLLTPIEDTGLINEHAPLMELLTTSLFPVISNHEKNNFAIAAPYQFCVFYYTENFRRLFFDTDEQHLLLPDGMPTEELKAIQCSMIYDHILEKFYGMKLNESPELIYPVTDADTGMLRYYKIRYDRRFIELHLKGKLPDLQDCAVCMNTFRILDLEKQLATMPLDLFEAEGFAVWVVEDVTLSESVERIKKILLCEKDFDTTGIDDLKKAVKVLIGTRDADVGLMPFIKVNDQFVLCDESGRHGLVARQWLGDDKNGLAQFRGYINFLNERPVPTPISTVNEELIGFATFLRKLWEEGTRSYLVYPMQNFDGLIGVLELSSPVQNLFTQETIGKLEPAIPMLSLAMLKCRANFQSRIEKVIMEKFTALQQSVEWKFAEVAWEYLQDSDSCSLTKNVVFDTVYPLYGAIDIRNSTSHRSTAIQKDLKEHLALIALTLQQLHDIIQLPLLEGLEFKNENMRQAIEDSMTAEDEIRINEFLQNEAEPIFRHLQKNYSEGEKVIDGYFNIIEDPGGAIHRHRCDYEETLSQINNAIMAYLENEEEAIQKSYPHYFEKFRTDGIEYNIYIGQSISPSKPFDNLYLKNIRLWQLKSMAGASKLTHLLLPQLKVPLQTTQLILVQSQCIDISFRRDERKFDVEGSYNTRYEIIKKRLDKVRIKETNERLTQPGKIAIVYSNQKEVPEYEEYIRFLQKKNILKQGIELLDLEELQGVKGLKAMRVEINLENE
jgi:hypothetical protein